MGPLLYVDRLLLGHKPLAFFLSGWLVSVREYHHVVQYSNLKLYRFIQILASTQSCGTSLLNSLGCFDTLTLSARASVRTRPARPPISLLNCNVHGYCRLTIDLLSPPSFHTLMFPVPYLSSWFQLSSLKLLREPSPSWCSTAVSITPTPTIPPVSHTVPSHRTP